MPSITVENLAKIIGSEGEALLSQMKEAGLSHKDVKDEVTDQDKKTLLEFLKEQQNKSSKTISLNKSAAKAEPEPTGTVSITRKTISRDSSETKTTDAQRTSSTINFDEIEKKRQAGEANKKAEEELRKKELEQKTLVTRRKAKTNETPQPQSSQKKVVQVAKRTVKPTRAELSKKEQRELEGESFLSNVEKQEFEKPVELVTKIIQIPESITVSELAQSLSVKGGEVVKQLMSMGVMATLNQPLDQDTAILVTEELGHKGEPAVKVEVEDQLMELVTYEGEEEPRNPVISVLGHVDHGKTTLLDYIRQANVAAGEDGGITQKIGAYQASTEQGTIAFIDTPGHAAFSEVRARGANSTDIVILVVAADDGLQPQTEEAISHAKAAGVPIVVAVNKMDREEADIEKVKTELSNKELIPEDWGGQTQFLPISALKGDGIKELLEAVSLEAEVLELKAHHKGPAFGVVLDSTTEVGKGAVATILVQKGTLKKGDMILVGEQTKRVRSLVDENGQTLPEAGPSVPASITGLDVPPKAGEEFVVVSSEKMAKEISNERAEKSRQERLARNQISNLEMLFESELGNHTILNIVLKADTHGSLEAIIGSIKNIENEEVKINIVHESVGSINANDVNLALTTNAFVMGFNVRADNAAKSLSEKESIEILYYSIIYDLIDGIKTSVEGHLAPEVKEEILGTAEVKDIFKSPKFGQIAGSIVIEGTIKRNKPIRVLRDDIVIFEGELDSLKRFKDDANEVPMGTECGIGVANYRDVKVGDKIEVFDRIEVKRTLD
ncbi:MAG: translation initiation factor IF-2 [Gammaproteobacteria bacterium]|nr:MAG: translation initiation factor IF-2 [Gammaproteobacteria bacterium]|tara:strand:- start:1465 stop:3819 length:2355 start_codon:yes stop_codon:yes gene_type:complete